MFTFFQNNFSRSLVVNTKGKFINSRELALTHAQLIAWSFLEAEDKISMCGS
jgi:hypothetical protein